MKAIQIDGRALAAKTYENIEERVFNLKSRGICPKLAVVLVGHNPASEIYVRSKGKKANSLGIDMELITFEDDVTQEKLVDTIWQLNMDSSVNGILVQLPLPEAIDSQVVLSEISPQKDVDGLHTYNAGALCTGRQGFIPCTPKGVIALIKSTGTEMAGKRAVVVGRSNLVGKPAALLLLQNNATVTICHSQTENLGVITREADILVAAVGKRNLITADMVKPGAVVIDVGQIKVDDVWCGDVDFEKVVEVAGYITPVPGGVGPMTIAMLMDNTIEAAERFG